MNKHTPGPWKAQASGSGSFKVGSARSGEHLAELAVGITDGAIDFDRMEADAKLMAAAPDLLASIKELLPLAERGATVGTSEESRDLWMRGHIARARAAIEAAENGYPIKGA